MLWAVSWFSQAEFMMEAQHQFLKPDPGEVAFLRSQCTPPTDKDGLVDCRDACSTKTCENMNILHKITIHVYRKWVTIYYHGIFPKWRAIGIMISNFFQWIWGWPWEIRCFFSYCHTFKWLYHCIVFWNIKKGNYGLYM